MAERWRIPDRMVGSDPTRWAVWYGPADVDGDCATEIDGDTADGWTVRTYQHVDGLIEQYDRDTPFLVLETHVGYAEADDYAVAVGIGVDRIAEQGGDESWAAELPQ